MDYSRCWLLRFQPKWQLHLAISLSQICRKTLKKHFLYHKYYQETEPCSDKALEFLIQSLAVRKEIDKKTSMAVSLDMIGHCYRFKGIYKEALVYYTNSFELREKLGQKIALDWSFRNLGLTYKENTSSIKNSPSFQDPSLLRSSNGSSLNVPTLIKLRV